MIPGSNSSLRPEHLEEHVGLLRSAGVILAQLEIPLETVERLGRLAAQLHIPFVLDPAPAQVLSAGLLQTVTWLTPNESETRSLLTGEAALPSIVEAARLIFQEDSSVNTVCEVLSMQLGPDEILMAATLDFNDDMSAPQLEEAADKLTKKLKAADSRITRVFLRPGRALT